MAGAGDLASVFLQRNIARSGGEFEAHDVCHFEAVEHAVARLTRVTLARCVQQEPADEYEPQSHSRMSSPK